MCHHQKSKRNDYDNDNVDDDDNNKDDGNNDNDDDDDDDCDDNDGGVMRIYWGLSGRHMLSPLIENYDYDYDGDHVDNGQWWGRGWKL